MKIIPVSTFISRDGFGPPRLNALVPNECNYTVLLMQPHGIVEATDGGVRNRDRNLAKRQFNSFLKDAKRTNADLVITPEYSMPWEVIMDIIKNGGGPELGKLWVFGCESIKYCELITVKRDIATMATMFFEPLLADTLQFTNPLVYVFRAPLVDSDGQTRMVVLVQFKTFPMGDRDHFEANNMQRGTQIYQFGDGCMSLKLVSLICSDVFGFLDADALAIYDRALVIHLQMNEKPRQEQFRMYRDRLLQFQGDQTEIICLNWARNVQVFSGTDVKSWKNVPASAWYLKPEKFDERDATLGDNHRRGLYYTWLKPLQVHALFFNYEPATYLLRATKVAHIGVPASISRRRGPQLTQTFIWDDATTTWVEQATADDGFTSIVNESGTAKTDIQRIADRNPFDAERVLALCAGQIGHSDEWHKVRMLDSCTIDKSEVIRRITFCQDTDHSAHNFRVARLKRCGHLLTILKTAGCLPPAIIGFQNNYRLEWNPDYPHQNAITASGERATLIYMGEDASQSEIDAVAKKAAEYLHRGFDAPNKSHDARQRLVVWYRDQTGDIKQNAPDRYTHYNDPGDTSEFDIGREI